MSLWLSLYATNLCIFHLALSCLVLTSITIVIIVMTFYGLVLHYNFISYLMFFNLISSADLFFIPFYSILLYFNLTRFYSILLNLIYYIVQYYISYHWMICVYLSVRLSVCVFICMNKILFSLLFFSLFLLSFFSLFSYLFSWTSSSHIHGHTHIHTHLSFFLWLVLLSSKAGKWRIVFEWLHYLIFDLIR